MHKIDTVRFFAAGSCFQKEALSLRGGAWRDVEFPAVCAVFRHPHIGWVLYDTGYDPCIYASNTKLSLRWYAKFMNVEVSQRSSVVAGLERLGLAPEDIALVVLSHFHPDHIGGARSFSKARFLCSREGYIAACTKPKRLGFHRELLPDDFEKRCEFVEDRSPSSEHVLRGLGGVYDVFGDGLVLCVLLDGHAPRQLALLIRGNARSCFLVSDAAWSTRAILENRPPHAITRLIQDDWQTLLRNLKQLNRLASENPTWRFVPSHCRESLATGECRLQD